MAALRLSDLKIVALRSAATADPVQRRRRKMIVQLERQRSLALDHDYTVPRTRWVNAVDGTTQPITAPKRVKRWWRVDPMGSYFLVLRYGNRILRLAEHGNAVEVGEWANMVPVLDTLVAAVAAGELDQALMPPARLLKPKKKRARSSRSGTDYRDRCRWQD
jgi:hypothetical protein